MRAKDCLVFLFLTGSLIAPFFTFIFIAGNLSVFDVLLLITIGTPINSLKFRKDSLLMAAILLFLVPIGLISILVNSYANHISTDQILYVLRWAYYALLVLLLASYVRDRPIGGKVVIYSVIASSIVTLILTWVAWFDSPRYILNVIPMLHLIHDGASVVINRNYLGFFLSVSTPALFFLWFYEKRSFSKKLFSGSLLIFISFGVIITFSKGAWVASFLPILLLVWFFSLSRSHIGMVKIPMGKILIGSMFAVILISFLPINENFSIDLFIQAIDDRISGSESTNFERLQFAAEAAQLMLQNPIFGVGPTLYRSAAIQQGFLPTSDPHNALLWIGSENGILAFGVLLFSIVLCFRYLLSGYKATGSDKALNTLAAAMLIAVVLNIPVHGLPLVMKHYWVIAAFLAGQAEYLKHLSKRY